MGKSVIVSALCRIFKQDGYKTAPFKAQNMALNSFVTKDGGEIGRAQAVQAQACKIEPTVDMNPILIKPSSDRRSQIIVMGKPIKNMSAVEYVRYKKIAKGIVLKSYWRLANKYELIVIEGAGSPAEINLKSHDIVNIKLAEAVSCPVILVGDIDKGGVFAWIVGTLKLLSLKERKRVKGIIINKFRGDKRLLKGGIRFLEKETHIKILGVIPYFKGIKIQEEDSVPSDTGKAAAKSLRSIQIDVIYLPHISNFTDFDALEMEKDVVVRYIKSADEIKSPDVIIIPGTKNTCYDLSYLKGSGIADKILSILNARSTVILIGICGGYQMLGEKINDPDRIESNRRRVDGLGLLPVDTTFLKNKNLAQVKATHILSGLNISGYEIHHGLTRRAMNCDAVFKIYKRLGRDIERIDGAKSRDGRVWGTYIHGVFDSGPFRRDFLNRIRVKKGLKPLQAQKNFDSEKAFDGLARIVRNSIDMDYLYNNILSIEK